MGQGNRSIRNGIALAALVVVGCLSLGQGCPGTSSDPSLPGASTIDSLGVSDAVVGGQGRVRVTLVDPVSVDTVVSLASSNTTVATVPATATIPTGGNNVEVAYDALAVGGAQITATLGDSSQTAIVTVVGGIRVTSIDVSRTLVAGSSGNLELYMGMIVPTDTAVTLSSSDPAVLAVPATVLVPRFSSYQDALMTAGSPGTATITATFGSSSVSAVVEVVSSVSLAQFYNPSDSTAAVGRPLQVVLILNASVATDTVVTLSSSNPAVVAAPASVTVPAGSMYTNFSLQPMAEGTATITASLNGSSLTLNEEVLGVPALETLSISSRLRTGEPATLTVWLDGAPAVDTSVSLVSTYPGVLPVPASITVPAGRRNGSITITPLTSGSALITASLGSSSITMATAVGSVSGVNAVRGPSKLQVGAVDEVVIDLIASSASATPVTFVFSDPTIATMPATWTIEADEGYTSVPIQGLAVGTTNLDVTLLGETFTIPIEVVATPAIAYIDPDMVRVGRSSFATIYLDASVAADTTITLTNSDPTVLQIPASVTVPAGQRQTTFTMKGLLASPPNVTVTATLGSSSENATITVLP